MMWVLPAVVGALGLAGAIWIVVGTNIQKKKESESAAKEITADIVREPQATYDVDFDSPEFSTTGSEKPHPDGQAEEETGTGQDVEDNSPV